MDQLLVVVGRSGLAAPRPCLGFREEPSDFFQENQGYLGGLGLRGTEIEVTVGLLTGSLSADTWHQHSSIPSAHSLTSDLSRHLGNRGGGQPSAGGD